MKTWVWIGLRKKEKPVLHISKWSTCRRFERKKETEASILIIVFFFFLVHFLLGQGVPSKGELFCFLWKSQGPFLAISVDMWHLLSGNAGLQWLGDLIASCLQERPREERPTVLLAYLHLQYCINKKQHCARPIPGHGYDHTLFP